jgi:hypothetical protein
VRAVRRSLGGLPGSSYILSLSFPCLPLFCWCGVCGRVPFFFCRVVLLYYLLVEPRARGASRSKADESGYDERAHCHNNTCT